MRKCIIGGAITLHSFLDRENISRIYVEGQLPEAAAKDWDGSVINVLDWKISDDTKTVVITYQLRDELYAAVMDLVLPVVQNSIPLEKPSRSRFWRLDEYQDEWVNSKTRERRAA